MKTKDLSYLSFEGIDNELKGLRLDALDALLYHVVSILVLHALQNVAVELADNVALKCTKQVSRHYHAAKVCSNSLKQIEISLTITCWSEEIDSKAF